MTASLVRCNSLHRFPLRDGCVDLIIMSPPFFGLRVYEDEAGALVGQVGAEDTPQQFLASLWDVTRECRRVLSDEGSLFCNLGDMWSAKRSYQVTSSKGQHAERAEGCDTSGFVPVKSLLGLPWLYALGATGALSQLGGVDPDVNLLLRAEIVWEKPNAMPESVTDRVQRSHEQWFHFTKQGRYFQATDLVREPFDDEQSGLLGRVPRSVWQVPTESFKPPPELGVEHYASFPQEWPRRLINGWCPDGICLECGQGRAPTSEVVAEGRHPGGGGTYQVMGQSAKEGLPDASLKARRVTGVKCGCGEYPSNRDAPPTRPAVVLDPFSGTGTTAMVANALGRHGIGFDLSAAYMRLATWRTRESGHWGKTLERQHQAAQGALF